MKTVVLPILSGVWIVLLGGLTGCLGRAPTTYELDRRAGLKVPSEEAAAAQTKSLSQLGTSSAVAPSPRMPVKVPPLVEKVWVSDLGLSEDARLQGTWMFIEVERGRWLDEVDPGGAPLLTMPGKAPALGAARPPIAGPPPAVVDALKQQPAAPPPSSSQP